MKEILDKVDYSFTIAPVNEEDKKIVLANTKSFLKVAGIIFCCIMAAIMLAILFFGRDKETTITALLIALSVLLFLFLLLAVLFFQVKTGLKNLKKIIENGVVIKQEQKSDDIGDTVYSYIGTEIFASLPGNVKVGDRISIEHTLNKKNKKNLFIKVEKL